MITSPSGSFQTPFNPERWTNYVTKLPPYDESAEKKPGVRGHWNRRLTTFQKLILVKGFFEEKVCQCKNDNVSSWFLVTPYFRGHKSWSE